MKVYIKDNIGPVVKECIIFYKESSYQIKINGNEQHTYSVEKFDYELEPSNPEEDDIYLEVEDEYITDFVCDLKANSLAIKRFNPHYKTDRVWLYCHNVENSEDKSSRGIFEWYRIA